MLKNPGEKTDLQPFRYAVYIVNSGEFGARNDGATPISNRRATSDDVPNFSSIDYSMFSFLLKLTPMRHCEKLLY
ncbi:MAG: palindromic element RPE2 domain-containing protein [Rickettsia endosymbiont of Labidopullus appendiculatus]|nr:palindromic element RPE2 domain-containing protein [Rickettsia endosymbiont of Labidopullus appendiculatus]